MHVYHDMQHWIRLTYTKPRARQIEHYKAQGAVVSVEKLLLEDAHPRAKRGALVWIETCKRRRQKEDDHE